MDESRARELLRQARERIESSLADSRRLNESNQSEIDTATDPTDDSEVIEEGQVDAAVDAQLRSELEAIERAEQRLTEGTYGFSVESGDPIPAGRLEAVPWAERTAEEQERFERRSG
jgi:DnaK suppressor protein